MAPGDGWDEWKEFVLAELKRHNNWLSDITDVQREILVAVAGLKVKSTIWGVIGGSIPVLLMMLIALVIWLVRG